jgi:hypothetical protein
MNNHLSIWMRAFMGVVNINSIAAAYKLMARPRSKLSRVGPMPMATTDQT